VHTADLARFFDVTPRVAMLSYSNFGSAAGSSPAKVREAVKLARKKQPDLEIDGEMEVDLAMLQEERNEFPFTTLTDEANVFVFPNLDAANIGYKLLWRLAGAEVIGPVLLGMNKPVNILQMHSDVQNIVSLAAVTALRAQSEEFPF
jgi:malate dehydrogenase (oxaloacetate-decarboxylating)(NADP+)